MMRQYKRARDDLRRRAYRVCPACGYELTERSIEGRCPECGSEYTPLSLKRDWEATYRRLLGAS